MANKNPEQINMNKILSQLLNPKETQSQRNVRIKKEVQEMMKR